MYLPIDLKTVSCQSVVECVGQVAVHVAQIRVANSAQFAQVEIGIGTFQWIICPRSNRYLVPEQRHAVPI